MRTVVLLLTALSLCACGRSADTAPFTASRLPPGAAVSAWPPAGWAWGLLKLGGRPAQRYGVSAPSGVPLGDVVILPSYGESAEWWFETARDLNREGYTVWIMDGAGQGGSERLQGPRNLGHLKDFDGDIQGITALIKTVIRPTKPVQVIAAGTSGLVALAAVERGAAVERLILSAPAELKASAGGAPAAAASVGLRTLRASGERGWSRPDPSDPLTSRQKTALGWAIANPDLRMGGPSAGWLIARNKLRSIALKPEVLASAKASVVVITPGEGADLCQSLPKCLQRPLPADLPYHVAEDPVRSPWIGALISELSNHAP